MTHLLRIADRVLNRPLLIDPAKAQIVLAVLEGRILPGFEDSEGAAAANLDRIAPQPDATRFVGSTGRDFFTNDPVKRPANVILARPDGSSEVVAEDVEGPNGPLVTPDGQTYLVAESNRNRLLAFDIRADGRLANRRVWAELDPLHPDATAVDVDIDASSIDTAMPVRDDNLRGAEFFDVERHPTIAFRSHGVTVLAAGRYTVHGELTIRGITQPVRLIVDVLGRAPDVTGTPRLGLRATAKVRRAVWGITWDAVVAGGGVALADYVELELDVSLVPG